MDFYFVWTPWGDEPEEQYLWEIFPCADGVLLSKGYVTLKLEESIVKHGGIQNFLRWRRRVLEGFLSENCPRHLGIPRSFKGF